MKFAETMAKALEVFRGHSDSAVVACCLGLIPLAGNKAESVVHELASNNSLIDACIQLLRFHARARDVMMLVGLVPTLGKLACVSPGTKRIVTEDVMRLMVQALDDNFQRDGLAVTETVVESFRCILGSVEKTPEEHRVATVMMRSGVPEALIKVGRVYSSQAAQVRCVIVSLSHFSGLLDDRGKPSFVSQIAQLPGLCQTISACKAEALRSEEMTQAMNALIRNIAESDKAPVVDIAAHDLHIILVLTIVRQSSSIKQVHLALNALHEVVKACLKAPALQKIASDASLRNISAALGVAFEQHHNLLPLHYLALLTAQAIATSSREICMRACDTKGFIANLVKVGLRFAGLYQQRSIDFQAYSQVLGRATIVVSSAMTLSGRHYSMLNEIDGVRFAIAGVGLFFGGKDRLSAVATMPFLAEAIKYATQGNRTEFAKGRAATMFVDVLRDYKGEPETVRLGLVCIAELVWAGGKQTDAATAAEVLLHPGLLPLICETLTRLLKTDQRALEDALVILTGASELAGKRTQEALIEHGFVQLSLTALKQEGKESDTGVAAMRLLKSLRAASKERVVAIMQQEGAEL
jgi:hypothetical protein